MPKKHTPYERTQFVHLQLPHWIVATVPKSWLHVYSLFVCERFAKLDKSFLSSETGHLTRSRAPMDRVTCLDCFDASVFEALLGESVGEENRGHEGEVLALGRLQGRARHKRVPAVGVIGR
jgi:hypothetical protein